MQPTIQAATEPSPRVLALVKDLGSDEFAIRQKAQHELEQLGPAALPSLKTILSGNLTDETRTRIGAATRRIADERRFGPSIITLHYTDAPLAEVLQDFAGQADADLGVNRTEIRAYVQSRKATVNLDHADFWTALSAVELASGLHTRPGDNGQLILDNTNPMWMGQFGDRSLARVSGPCIVAPQSISMFMQYGRGNTAPMTLQLVAMVEPKLRVVRETRCANASTTRETRC
jgi:hypothetical protein